MSLTYQYILIGAGLVGVLISLMGDTWDAKKQSWIKFTFRGWIGFVAAIAGASFGAYAMFEQEQQLTAERDLRIAEERNAQRMGMIGLLRTEAALRGLVEPMDALYRKYYHVMGSRSGPMLFQFSLGSWGRNDLDSTLDIVPLNEHAHFTTGNVLWRDHFRTTVVEYRLDADRITAMYGRYLPPSVLVLLDEIRSGPYVRSLCATGEAEQGATVGDIVSGFEVNQLAARVMELADTLKSHYVDTVLSHADADYYRRYRLMDFRKR